MCQATLEMIEARMQTGDNGALLLDVAIVMMLCVDRSSDGPAGQSTAAAAFCCSLFSQILVRLERDLGLAPSIADEESVPDHCDKEANGDADDGIDGEKEEDEDGLWRAEMRRRRVASDSGDDCAEEKWMKKKKKKKKTEFKKMQSSEVLLNPDSNSNTFQILFYFLIWQHRMAGGKERLPSASG